MDDNGLTVQRRLEPFGPAAAIVLSGPEVDDLGGGSRAAVRVTIGDRTARLRLAVMGGQHVIGLSKAARAELGVETGAEVTAHITLDEAPREVELPPELASALAADPEAAASYERLAFTHRKEYAVWVAEAKRPETRARRVEQAVAMIREGRGRS